MKSLNIKANIKNNIKRLKKLLTKIPIILTKSISSTCFFIFFITLIIGAFLYYKYDFLLQKTEFDNSNIFQLKEKIYQEISAIWQEEKNQFEETNLKEYPDPFKKYIIKTEEEISEEELTE